MKLILVNIVEVTLKEVNKICGSYMHMIWISIQTLNLQKAIHVTRRRGNKITWVDVKARIRVVCDTTTLIICAILI